MVSIVNNEHMIMFEVNYIVVKIKNVIYPTVNYIPVTMVISGQSTHQATQRITWCYI